VEHVEDERMVFEMHGELEGQITLTYEEEVRGTRLTYSAEYDVSTKVLEKLLEPFVCKYNEREVETTLRNVKTRMEATGG